VAEKGSAVTDLVRLLVERGALVAAIAGAIAVVLALFGDSARVRAVALEEMTGRALAALGHSAAIGDRRLVVDVVQDGGPNWIRPAILEAVGRSRSFEAGESPFMLRVEVVEHPHALALQLHLFRQGWSIRLPSPVRARFVPWTCALALALGAIVAARVRRIGVGLLVAGLVAELALLFVRIEGVPRSGFAEIGDAPLTGQVLALTARVGTTATTAVGAAVVVFCLVLVAFDHRRSRSREGSLDLGSATGLALAGACGGVLALEAAFRSGFVAALAGPAGMACALALVCAWFPGSHAAGARTRARS
jgi:hypothetical protein